jgi:hypothetical protein
MELWNAYLLAGLGNLPGLPRNRPWDPLRLRTIPTKPQAMGMQTAVESKTSKGLCRMCTDIKHQTPPTENDEKGDGSTPGSPGNWQHG